MKKIIITSITILMSASITYAGFPPSYSCTNDGATIAFDGSAISVLVNKYPSQTYEKFNWNNLEVTEKVIQEIPEERDGCTSRSVVFKQITLTKKDGSPMPNAYNQNAKNGNLTDYFICVTAHAWLPREGQTCN